MNFKEELNRIAFEFRDSDDSTCESLCAECELGENIKELGFSYCQVLIGIINQETY